MHAQILKAHTHLAIDLDVFAYKLDFMVGVLHECSQTLLYTLHLLRDGTKDTFFETVELVETSPCANLTETDEDTAHCLEVKRLVATKNQDESAQLYTQCLHRFRFPCIYR